MPDSEREYKIIDYLKEHRQASVQELASLLYVSAASIRRDLNRMQNSGIVKRTHGGVVYGRRTDETAITVRRTENSDKKDKTVNIALKRMPEFETVFIDDSSTCFMLAEKLDLSNKTVITNGIQLALYLSYKNNVTVILPGGTLSGKLGAITGSETIEQLQRFRFDLTLTSCAALDGESVFEKSTNNSVLKRTVISRGKYNYLLFDSGKLNRSAPYMTVSLDAFDAVISNAADEELTLFRSKGINVINK